MTLVIFQRFHNALGFCFYAGLSSDWLALIPCILFWLCFYLDRTYSHCGCMPLLSAYWLDFLGRKHCPKPPLSPSRMVRVTTNPSMGPLIMVFLRAMMITCDFLSWSKMLLYPKLSETITESFQKHENLIRWN